MIEKLRVRIPAGATGEFFSPELIFCANSYSVSVPPCVMAVARKRPRSFCQKCRWQMTSNMHTPLTQRSWSGLTMLLSRHSVGTYRENKLTHNLPENTGPQSFKLTEPLCTDHGLKSGISVCRLISTSKKKKCRWGMNG